MTSGQIATLALIVMLSLKSSADDAIKAQEMRQHFDIKAPEEVTLYEFTTILRLSDEIDESVVLVRDEGHGDYLLRHTWSFPTQTGGAQPTHGGGFADLFIARLSPTLTSVVNATYFGGTDDEEPGTNALLISGGHVFVVGHSTSDTLPGITGAAQETKGGPTDDYADAFIARFSADLTTLDQSTWFGGSAHESGSALTAGPTGIIYLAGGQPGTQLPGTSGAAIDTFAGGDGDGFIAAFTPT